MTYHSREALENLGETIRDKAIQVIVTLFNEYTRSRTTGGAVGDPVLFAGKNPNLPASFTTHAPTEGELRAYLWGCYSDIPGLFVSSSGSNPENCKQSIDSLWESAFILHPSLTPTTSNGKLSYPIPESFSWDETPLETRINNIGHLCDSWDGEASDAFASYVGQFSTAIDLQHDLAVALAVTLDAHREILSRSYFDIWNIGQETLKALDTIGDCDPQATSVTLTVVGALAAVLAEFATGGPGHRSRSGRRGLGALRCHAGSVDANRRRDSAGCDISDACSRLKADRRHRRSAPATPSRPQG
jgi:hypothetical protein